MITVVKIVIIAMISTVATANPLDLYCNKGITEAGGLTILRDLKKFDVYSCSDAARFDLAKFKTFDKQTRYEYGYSLDTLRTFAALSQFPRMRVEEMVPLTRPKEIGVESESNNEPKGDEAGTCINMTPKKIGVFGSVSIQQAKKGRRLYGVKPHHQTPKGWDCDGFYIPNDRVYDGWGAEDHKGPGAVEVIDYMTAAVLMDGNRYRVQNVTSEFHSLGTANWQIPNQPEATEAF